MTQAVHSDGLSKVDNRLVAERPRLGTEDLVGRLLDPRDDVHEDRDPPNLSLVSKRLLS